MFVFFVEMNNARHSPTHKANTATNMCAIKFGDCSTTMTARRIEKKTTSRPSHFILLCRLTVVEQPPVGKRNSNHLKRYAKYVEDRHGSSCIIGGVMKPFVLVSFNHNLFIRDMPPVLMLSCTPAFLLQRLERGAQRVWVGEEGSVEDCPYPRREGA